MEEFTPELFGKYVLVDRIATGGMAEIFLAKSYALGGFEGTFVLKRILPHLGADPSFVELFVTEAKVSVGLQHPNVVRVFDFGQEAGHYFLVMEHIEGRDARRVMRAAGQARAAWPLDLALYVVSEACKGLHYAHTRTAADGSPLGIVHRDVSPSNLLLSWDGSVKLADFGIARAEWVVGEEEAGIKGKYEYMAPEQATGGPVDGRSDVFALGAVLYELVMGRRAFRGVDEQDTLRRLLAQERAPVGGAPDEVVAIIDTALAGAPEARFASAREMGEAVRRALGGASDDALRERLAAFLRELFAAEIVAERERMLAASELG
ncbi:MAG TPA: serine/threonine-protein kinase, partial [Myxococcota bacterium]|nr:serine/threonine-protein kinase [Myxococcota bacterium]